MKRKLFFIVTLCSLFSLTISAQNKVKSLKIGDKVPDVELGNLINYPSKTLKLSDFKGKLIILDFWNRYCTSCIQSFPEMQELQEEFGDSIQIILVTNDTREKLQRVFQVSENIKNNKLPMIIGDSVLHALFPHYSVPFHVWIDKSGIIQKTTSGWNTNKTNLSAYLKGKSINISNLKVVLPKDKLKLPMIEQYSLAGGGVVDKMISYSFLSRRNMYEARSGWSFFFVDSTEKTPDYRGSSIFNLPIIDLFRFCYLSRGAGGIHIKTIVETKNAANISKYYPPKDKDKKGEWIAENTYCYEAKVNQIAPSYDSIRFVEKLDFITSDLERLFKIYSSLDKRRMKCYVLKMRPGLSKDLLQSKGGAKVVEKTKNGECIIRNGSMYELAQEISSSYGDYNGPDEIPVLNETGYLSRIDVSFPLNKSKDQTLSNLRNILALYGLELIEEERSVECLVLTEI